MMSNLQRHEDCPMRTHVGNCLIIGGFCTSIREDICDALHKSFQMGTRSRAKEGEWIDKHEWENGFYERECSICGAMKPQLMHTAKINFCPNCGADMRGEAE